MSTPEVELLLKILPKVARMHPEWFTEEELQVAQRLINELIGRSSRSI